MRYVISHNNADIIHYAELSDNQDMSTAQPNVEEFTDRQQWVNRLTELGIEDIPEPSPEPTKAFNHRQEQEIKRIEKTLKEENKLLKDRIADAKDFDDFKSKIVKVKDSEDTPTKWSDKIPLLEGERIEHKGDHYIVLRDHTADKDKEPPNELYRRA